MALDHQDAVGDQTSITGTVDFVIDGVALPGCVKFASALTTGATYNYRCQNIANSEWEVGQGVWTAATNTLSRVTVFRSSAAGAKTTFSAGTKSVALVAVASDLVSTAPGGTGTELQYRNAGAFGAMSGTAWDNVNLAETRTGATVITSNPVQSFTQTWNAGTVTFTGWKMNITDTASAAASLLADLQVGGVSKFNVAKDGTIVFAGGNGSLSFTNSPAEIRAGASAIKLNVNGSVGGATHSFESSGNIQLLSVGVLGFTSDLNARSTLDTGFSRVSAGIIGVGTGTVGAVNGSLKAKTLLPTGGTVTVSAPVVDATQTWNNVATVFTGWRLNITDTTSDPTSILSDLQVGGVSRFKVDKTGTIWASGPGSTTGLFTKFIANTFLSLYFGNDATGASGKLQLTTGSIGLHDAANHSIVEMGTAGYQARPTQIFGFTSTNGAAEGTADTAISRISAGVIGVGTGAAGATDGTLKATNLISSGGVITTSSFTVATLPSASTSGAGSLATATDLTALTNGSTATGAGTLKGIVKSDGTNWIVLG